MKHYLIFKKGRHRKVISLTDLVADIFELSKSEAKRVIEQGGIDITRESR